MIPKVTIIITTWKPGNIFKQNAKWQIQNSQISLLKQQLEPDKEKKKCVRVLEVILKLIYFL